MKQFPFFLAAFAISFMVGCNADEPMVEEPKSVLADFFGNAIDFDNLENYAKQDIPAYINKDNTRGNDITDEGATLGRVLFYDKMLSIDNSVACSSCHKQEHAFGDTEVASKGVAGTTGRHSMRLINARFSDEIRFFWDERATSLEDQTTRPIQDHIEMGYSGEDDRPGISDLLVKLNGLKYYRELFFKVYNDSSVTEEKMQLALAQFVRSIQSFDSKYDAGRAMAANDAQPFSNFTDQENEGKNLFIARPQVDASGVRTGGGLGCGGCHRVPEFDIDPNTGNNGVISSFTEGEADIDVTRSPSLRDIVKVNGEANGPFMHSAIGTDLNDVLDHYNEIPAVGNGLDRRLMPAGNPQQLMMTQDERDALIAFLKTLAGSDVYTNQKWSDPFLQ